ncbi:MAG: YlxM family DNA-binding protein [Lachnospiraceae bacterium]
MEKIVEQTMLYDFYGELLTNHQKHIYEEVVFNDLSYSEIAEEEGISRQGVHDLIKRCNKILYDYEEKLHLVERFMRTKKLAEEVRQLTQDYRQSREDAFIDKIEAISIKILEEI